MDFIRDRSAQTITINGKSYSVCEARIDEATGKSALHELMLKSYGEQSFYVDLAKFLEQWFDDSDLLQVQTSGSTGTPKKLMVEKERMMNSACMTLSFLNLNAGDSALLCMPLAYIAGKMVVVRSLVGSLNLCVCEPSSNPMLAWYEQEKNLGKADSDIVVPTFAAMVPLQVYNCVRDERSDGLLRQVRELIIGGGAVDNDLGERLCDYPNHVWSTYGMTETLSHIALRRINQAKQYKGDSLDCSDTLRTSTGESFKDDGVSWYEPFDGVTLSISDAGGLVIDAPAVCAEKLITNDVVVFNEQGHFKVIGRLDNVINTGGIKVQIEVLENEIAQDIAKHLHILNVAQVPLTEGSSLYLISQLEFMVTSRPDDKFGEVIVLLYSFKDGIKREVQPGIFDFIFMFMEKYHKPKIMLYVDTIPLTGTGKPDRATAKKIAAAAVI